MCFYSVHVYCKVFKGIFENYSFWHELINNKSCHQFLQEKWIYFDPKFFKTFWIKRLKLMGLFLINLFTNGLLFWCFQNNTSYFYNDASWYTCCITLTKVTTAEAFRDLMNSLMKDKFKNLWNPRELIQ